jgi:ubiquinone/menaquinone biosynthesis C-methylase UbiE
VLEIGCGTGQLTRSPLARGLRVTAIEPGERMIARARDQLGSAGEVEFVNRRLEEASLPQAHYRPRFRHRRFTGSIRIHVAPGDQHALRAAMARVVPELAANWPTYRDLDGTLGGVDERRGNV